MLTHLRYGGLLSGVIAAYLHVNFSNRITDFFKYNYFLSNALILLSLVLFVIISSLSLGQGAPLIDSIFYDLPSKFGVYYEIIHRELFSYAILFIMLACLYSESRIIKPVDNFLSSKIFYPIAKISYSAYLFHVMFMEWFFPIFSNYFEDVLTPIEIVFANGSISVIITLIVSGLMVVFIEDPFNSLKNRLTK